jgi:hypothetical protein
MNTASSKPYVIFVLCIIVVAAIWVVYERPWELPYNADAKFQDAPKEALQSIRDMLTLLTTLATALIGGIIFFFTKRHELKLLHRPMDRFLLLGALTAGAMSLYFGLALHASLVDMLANGVFDSLAPGVARILSYQYNSIIIGVVLTALLIARHLGD